MGDELYRRDSLSLLLLILLFILLPLLLFSYRSQSTVAFLSSLLFSLITFTFLPPFLPIPPPSSSLPFPLPHLYLLCLPSPPCHASPIIPSSPSTLISLFAPSSGSSLMNRCGAEMILSCRDGDEAEARSRRRNESLMAKKILKMFRLFA